MKKFIQVSLCAVLVMSMLCGCSMISAEKMATALEEELSGEMEAPERESSDSTSTGGGKVSSTYKDVISEEDKTASAEEGSDAEASAGEGSEASAEAEDSSAEVTMAPLSYTLIDGIPDGMYFVEPAQCTASSEVYWNGTLFAAANMISTDDSCWQESDTSGCGVGEWAQIDFNGTYSVRCFAMRLGYGKDEAGYYWNSRPKTLVFSFSDGSSVECEFPDAGWGSWQYMQLSEPVTTSYVKVTIVDAYEGTEWQDTSITEIRCYSAVNGQVEP